MSFGPESSTRLYGWVIGGLACLLFVWIAFFDSHSLLKRYQWHQEHERLTEENEQLRRDIERLREQIDRPLSDSLIERLAREKYGMKRPDETVYQLKSKE